MPSGTEFVQTRCTNHAFGFSSSSSQSAVISAQASPRAIKFTALARCRVDTIELHRLIFMLDEADGLSHSYHLIAGT
jgi:hypothetical protein